MNYPANTYELGETVTITGVFKEDGVLGDPLAVRFIHRNPADVITILEYPADTEITKVSTGVYSIDLNLDVSGFWHYRIDDGLAHVAVERDIQVKTSKLITIPPPAPP